jgi:hypothetical protein
MDDRELLSRIDRHLARGNELFDRNTEAFDRNTEAFDRNTEAFESNRDVILGLQQFARDLAGRFERTMRSVEVAMREHAASAADLAAAAKAHEQTLFFILDELKALRRADGPA